MSKQLHKNFNDEQVKSLFKSYLNEKLRLNISCKCLESKEVDSLNYWVNIQKIQIIFLSNIKERPLITE